VITKLCVIAANGVYALADVVATKLGIILLFFFLLPSTYFFLLCGHGVHALWLSEHLPSAHTYSFSFFLPSNLALFFFFAYDFEFVHAFLRNKKIRFSLKKMGGTPLHPPNCHFWVDSRLVKFLGVPKWNGVRALWESEDPLWRMRY